MGRGSGSAAAPNPVCQAKCAERIDPLAKIRQPMTGSTVTFLVRELMNQSRLLNWTVTVYDAGSENVYDVMLSAPICTSLTNQVTASSVEWKT